jgi:aldehyde dehydrogenase (NAD+)
MYIAGAFTGAADGKTFEDKDPSTGQVWAQIPDASRADTKRAIAAAAEAFPKWSRLSPSERSKCLLRAADIVEKRKEEIAVAIVEEAGSWIGKGFYETTVVQTILRYAASTAFQVTGEILPSDYGKVSMVVRQPLGVVTVISPWNFPMLLSARGLGVTLAVGNTVVLKPSEETPYSGGIVFAEVLKEAGVPDGVFNVVTCSRDHVDEVGDELVCNPKIKAVSFTGSTAVGRQIGALAGQHLKRACLELGGKDALIVLDDADIERAVNAATFGTFMHQGQICMAVKKIVVHERVAAEFTQRFVDNVKTLKMGNPRDMGHVIGPIINQKQLDKIIAHVADAVDKGAQLLTGGKHEGLFYQATVLGNVRPGMRVYSEETFGPVAPIVQVANDDEAVAVANDSEYGLSAGIITADEERGLAIAHRLETGMAHINDSSVNDEPWVPFGGVKSSGLGRHGGKAAIDTFTETRWLTLERGGRKYPPPFVIKK